MERFAELAHDLRMPMQVILSCAQLLRTELDAASPAGEYAAMLLESARQAQALLERQLDDPDVPRLASFDLPRCLRGLCRRCAPWAEARGVRLGYTGNVDALTVVSDDALLGRALMNLIANALRFTPPGGRISLRLTALGDAVEISACDTGCGIPPERLERVFREGETTGGHGFGLPIARRLAKALGGSLRASSAPGGGAVFTLRLPVNGRTNTQ